MEFKKGENRYYVLDGDKEVGQVTYSVAEDTILIIDHTEVGRAYGGQGIAGKLVKLVVDKAIAENKLIIPLCPFAAREFANNPEYQKIQKR